MADAPTTEEVRAELRDRQRDVRERASDVARGCVVAMEAYALPLAEHRDRLAAEVERLTGSATKETWIGVVMHEQTAHLRVYESRDQALTETDGWAWQWSEWVVARVTDSFEAPEGARAATEQAQHRMIAAARRAGAEAFKARVVALLRDWTYHAAAAVTAATRVEEGGEGG